MKAELIHSPLCDKLCDLCEILCDLCGKRQTLIGLQLNQKNEINISSLTVVTSIKMNYHLPPRAQRVTQSGTE